MSVQIQYHNRTLATNGAKIYNMSLSKVGLQPPSWGFSFQLRTEHVWDAFVILNLLEECEERNEVLQVPHSGDQDKQFTEAMQQHNERFERNGQPEWSHYCEGCMQFWEDEKSVVWKLQVAVTDGVLIGRHSCNVLHCAGRLASV
jgi:hypothetical protein